MRQAGRLKDAIARIELGEAGIALGLENTGEPGERGARVLAIAIGGVTMNGAAGAAAERAIVAGTSSRTARFSSQPAQVQHRHRGKSTWRRGALSACRASASSRGRSSAAGLTFMSAKSRAAQVDVCAERIVSPADAAVDSHNISPPRHRRAIRRLHGRDGPEDSGAGACTIVSQVRQGSFGRT